MAQKDRRYSIQPVRGGTGSKVFEARFNSDLLGIGKTRYEAEQLIHNNKKERSAIPV